MRKGVYMDGYERPDVVEYQKNDFLPLMALHEKNMVQWLANGTEHIDLKLGPGDKRVIAVFQDESAFHVNEYKAEAWCAVTASLEWPLDGLVSRVGRRDAP